MNILVTGANGFVGKELVSELKNRKHNVFEFDLANGKNILNRAQITDSLKKIDVVIHLAAIIENNNQKLWEVNVTGTKNLIEESVNARIKKFVFLSSTGVYGKQKGSISEDSEVIPENNYEKSKVEAENIVLQHQEEISVNIVRSAMILGANDYWKKMFKILKKGFPLPCSGKNSFQIIYVRELINAIITVMEKGEPGEIYLVAGKEQWTLREFCKKTKGIMELKERMFSIPEVIAIIIGKLIGNDLISSDNIRHLKKNRKYIIEKIGKIGFKHKYTIEEAITETLEELKEIDSDTKN